MTPRESLRRAVLVGGVLVVLLAGGVLVELVVGRGGLSTDAVWSALAGRPKDRFDSYILDLRLSRAVGAVTAGAALGIAGALLQTVTRNPLAEPGMLGISSGAVLGVVASLWAGIAVPGGAPVAAVLGAASAPVLIAAVLGRRWDDPRELALTGILVGLLLAALGSGVLLASGETLGTILRWMIGSLNAVSWTDLTLALPMTLLGVALSATILRPMGALALGDEQAVSIGARPRLLRAIALLAAVLLTSGAVVIAGALAFLGLAAPHLAGRLVGRTPLVLLATSALVGAGVLVAADIIAVSMQFELPGVGTVTGLPVGAVIAPLAGPYMLVLLRRRLH